MTELNAPITFYWFILFFLSFLISFFIVVPKAFAIKDRPFQILLDHFSSLARQHLNQPANLSWLLSFCFTRLIRAMVQKWQTSSGNMHHLSRFKCFVLFLFFCKLIFTSCGGEPHPASKMWKSRNKALKTEWLLCWRCAPVTSNWLLTNYAQHSTV